MTQSALVERTQPPASLADPVAQERATTRLIRLAGVAALLGGAMLVIPDAVGGLTGTSGNSYGGTTLEQVWSGIFLAGKLLVAVGLPGLYLYQAERAGKFGLISFLMALIGTTLMVGSDWSEVFIAPLLKQSAPALVDHPPTRLMAGFLMNFGLETLGWLLFGIATFRARVFSRAAAGALMIGVLLPLAGPSWSFVVWNAAIAWMGFVVMQQTREHALHVAQPEPFHDWLH